MHLLGKLLSQYTFTRALIAISIANFVCLVLLNLLELPTYNLVYFYAAAFVAFYQITGYLYFRKRLQPFDKWAILISLVMLFLLTLPRISYLLDWIPGNEVRVYADDHARLAELISLTLSEKYPLLHPANRDYLLSFYYETLYPMAFLKFISPTLTLKNTIFFGNFLYHILILGSLLEFAHLLLPTNLSNRVFIFLCTLFSGLDWLSDPTSFNTGFEWWQHDFINGDVQISSYITGLFWVFHHFVAFYIVALAYLVFFYTRTKHRWLKSMLVLLLLAAAFYASPFSVMPVPLFAIIHLQVIGRRLVRTWTFAYVAIAALVPLFIFAGKLPAQGFKFSNAQISFTHIFWVDKILSAPIYLTVVPLVEFTAIPFLLLLVFKQMPRVEKAYFLAATGFFCLIYVVAYSGWNNFAMRGMFMPTFVFFFLFAKYCAAIVERLQRAFVPSWAIKAVTTIVVILTLIGTLKTFASLSDSSMRRMLITYQIPSMVRIFGSAPPQELQGRYEDIVGNPNIVAVVPDPADRYTDYKYNMEKFIDTLSIDEMFDWEKELVRAPRQGLIR